MCQKQVPIEVAFALFSNLVIGIKSGPFGLHFSGVLERSCEQYLLLSESLAGPRKAGLIRLPLERECSIVDTTADNVIGGLYRLAARKLF